MSVLIRGMEMPKCCDECLLTSIDYKCNWHCVITYDCFDSNSNERLPNCPLEEYDEAKDEDDGRQEDR